jgi:3'(2'), 5'-bisphosphate nucleotidase
MTDTPNESGLSELLPQVVQIARQAGEAVMRVYAEVNPAVEYKRDKSPLTQADLASHRIIDEGLMRIAPQWPVLSEESKEIPFDQRRGWQRFWLVDPLDGTKEFLKHNGEFTVNIALMEEGRPILGVVYAPAMDLMYYAARGAGAWKAEGGSVEAIRISRAAHGRTRVVTSRSHASIEDNLGQYTSGDEACDFVTMGSSLKFCLVAEGAADLYPRTGPTMEWDTAAAQCVVEQAGGTVTDLEGNPMLYNKPVLLNPGFIARGEAKK